VEGKRFAMTITDGFVDSPDFDVDFRRSDVVDGDMDVAAQDFDFDVGRTPGLFRGWLVGFDLEVELRVEAAGASTLGTTSYFDIYWI